MATENAVRMEKIGSQSSAPRLTLSLAAFALICFFLPWLQVSCVGMRGSISGYDLAHGGERALWLAPLMMALVVAIGLACAVWRPAAAGFALAGMVGGGINVYLMLHERAGSGSGENAGLISAQWTPWFWFGLLASAGVAASALHFYIRGSRAP
jgi:hypothetical protein